MSEVDQLFAGLGLDISGFEAEFRATELPVDEERSAIERRLREYGALDRAYDRAEEYTHDMGITLPDRDTCQAMVYREVRSSGWEAGGGVQIYGQKLGPDGLTRYAVRVPAYTLNEEKAIRPAGGVFDDYDAAEMVAAQADGLMTLAEANGIALTPDLTGFAYQEDELRDLVVITCTPRDEF